MAVYFGSYTVYGKDGGKVFTGHCHLRIPFWKLQKVECMLDYICRDSAYNKSQVIFSTFNKI